MTANGVIITSTGETKKLFKKNKIKNIKDFLIIDDSYLQNKIEEAYSSITQMWYSFKTKEVEGKYLVWLDNVTESIYLDIKLGIQSQFSNEIMDSINDLVLPLAIF